MVFCNSVIINTNYAKFEVTILILIDGFLQSTMMQALGRSNRGHNPYFNRWFSAIKDNFGYNSSFQESQSLF